MRRPQLQADHRDGCHYGLKTRLATEKDEEVVVRTFGSLGYKIIVHRNLTKTEMTRELYKVSEVDHSENTSFVCVILSHGNKEGICATDGTVELKNLTYNLKGDNCVTLLGKPKLFFLQACRGEKLDVGVVFPKPKRCEMKAGSAAPMRRRKPPPPKKIPLESDFFYAYATTPGYYAWRNNDRGSFFIQSLCEILPKYRDLELMQIMTKINRKVAYDFESSNRIQKYNENKAMPCFTSMLTKEFYFPK
ncbi:hypothetical protein WMY93_009282 [Mugilogobius chulae]|uniref:Caspase 3 n=1 Tax=Mugilogobius chulae TaxID=88201 RepID=A0AAW0PK81_9GOBI